MVRASDDLLGPMANLCGGGEPNRLIVRKLRESLARDGAR